MKIRQSVQVLDAAPVFLRGRAWFSLLAGAVGLVSASCQADMETAAEVHANQAPDTVQVLRARAHPLTGPEDLDPLLQRIGAARLVLLGEASHGTSEFYTWRAAISRRLITEKGFNFVVVEGDWASLYRLNRYVRHLDDEYGSALEVMQTFNRWPVWMWANEETREFIEWLRSYNRDRSFAEQVGFYGLDVYGEDLSMRSVAPALRATHRELAERIAAAYACFEPYRGDMHQYARAVARGAAACSPAVTDAYLELRALCQALEGPEQYAFFAIKHNARVVKNAERHFRLMALQDAQSWNARVAHFYTTVARLLALYGAGSRAVAWAHNTHIGDARATDMSARGQKNIGQMAREELGAAAVVAVGFGTHRGTVCAGRAWGAPMEIMRVPQGGRDSVEDLMHQTDLAQALFIFDQHAAWSPWMTPRGHRAIGVVYHPGREYPGNYVPTILPLRYDAFIFIAETRALRPIPLD